MTERELRQSRHQIGEAPASDRLPLFAAWALVVALSLALWAAWWVGMTIVNAWLQPGQ